MRRISVVGATAATVAVVALAVSAVLMGCGRKGTGGPDRPRIAGIVFQQDQFFRLIQFGMRDAAKKGGAELLEGNSANKPDKEIQLVNTYIARGVDAIVISPLSTKASVAGLKRAKEKGIKIVTYNSTVEGDIPAAYIESDPHDLGAQTGRAAVKYINTKLGGKAKIAILAFKSQLPEQSDARTGGFKSEVTKLPGVEIVAEQDAWEAEQAKKKAGYILTANPGLDIIWSANEGGTVGSVLAVKNEGKAGRIAVFGTDTSEQLAGFLLSKDNILQAITGQKPFEIGARAVETALDVLAGRPVKKKVSMSGVLLSRDDPEGVRAFQKRLKELISR